MRRVKETYRISSAVTATDRIKDGFSFDSVVSLNGNSAEITDGKLKSPYRTAEFMFPSVTLSRRYHSATSMTARMQGF